jgi:formate hydrogenlyase subunit 6/NADH:ubiquinone oxidoreductase subunit I
MGLPLIGGVTKMAKTKKSRISPIFKRAASHIFTKPATTKYPFVKPVLPQDSRGSVVYEIKDCNIIDFDNKDHSFAFDVKSIMGSNCRVCVRDCPSKAIEIVEVDGKKRPQIDLNKCVFCYQCVESCPRQAIKSSVLYELATTDKGTLIMKPKSAKEAKV